MKGTTAAQSRYAAMRARKVGAFTAERTAITANPTGMMVSNHHSGTPPASVSMRVRSARIIFTEANARTAITKAATRWP